jgi:hypothetical protein
MNRDDAAHSNKRKQSHRAGYDEMNAPLMYSAIFHRGLLVLAGTLMLAVPVLAGPAAGGVDGGQEIRSGTLLVPGEEDQSKERKEQCMTVCLRWGEDCVIDHRGIRRCRRTCQEFGEQCF